MSAISPVSLVLQEGPQAPTALAGFRHASYVVEQLIPKALISVVLSLSSPGSALRIPVLGGPTAAVIGIVGPAREW
jgi:hypothetical protein